MFLEYVCWNHKRQAVQVLSLLFLKQRKGWNNVQGFSLRAQCLSHHHSKILESVLNSYEVTYIKMISKLVSKYFLLII